MIVYILQACNRLYFLRKNGKPLELGGIAVVWI
jgi:hypothetical protein